jgi:ribulose-5-phosphate 4-epimerase/fuculose-1-phosphate aldolase
LRRELATLGQAERESRSKIMTPQAVERVLDVPTLEGKVSEEEWKTRVNLAACYRLVRRNGWNSGIYNHVSARVPGEPDSFLIKAHALMWDEVTASNLIKVDMHDELDERSYVNRPGFVLHSAVLRARDDANAVVHIHPPACVAVSASTDGLLPLCQDAVRFHGRLAYHDYEGITEDAEERSRIIANLGDKPAMLMRNHGATTLGRTIREAYVLMACLVSACEIQLRLLATGQQPVLPSPEVCARTAKQLTAHEAGRGQDDWPGFLRQLDREDPSYRV